ncbi:MAG TPA: carbohydrate ABC transporter permease [Candidatus Dormibacteraeota bacterium]|nr:carbohydrate ABC transporter permease [Candidatus Dormibacteraeota bacterium]
MARRVGAAAFLAIMLAFSLAPLYWMLVVSVKGGKSQLISGNPWWPGALFTLQNYAQVLRDPDFGRLILNTALVTVATIAVSLTASVLAALGLAYYRLRVSSAIALALFAGYLLPQGVLFIPLAVMLSRLHLFGGIAALIIVYPTLAIPFGTWVLWTYFHRLPTDLVDNARAEGAGVLRVLWEVLLPLSWPAVAAVCLFGAAVVFNDYLYTFTLVSEHQNMTLMADVGSNLLDIDDPGPTFAEILLGLGPVALTSALFADVFGKGLGAGVIE